MLESILQLTFAAYGYRSVGLSCAPPWPWALCAWPPRMTMSCASPVSNLPVRDPLSFASSSKTQPGSCGL